MKQRFSSLDVKVISLELNEALSSLRLSNAYDLSSRIFLFKFAKPNVRQQLIIDSGFRCHLTKFSRTTATEPSAFVARLRKFLRTRRVTGVSQVGTDRVIEFTFGDGQYRLFLEFFAAGNVILTDADLKILTLLRVVPHVEGQEELRVGSQYLLQNRKNYGGVPDVTTERVLAGLRKAAEKAKTPSEAPKKAKKRTPDSLRKALAASLDEIPPALIEHVMSVKGFSMDLTSEDLLNDSSMLDQVVGNLKDAHDLIARISSENEIKGYITARTVKPRNDAAAMEQDTEVDKENVAMMYEEFHPFCPHQFTDRTDIQILDFDGFNATVDEFFSSMESQKLEARITERQEQAKKKLEANRTDHDKRLLGLQQVQDLNKRKAQAIESNIQRVQEVTAAINGLIAQGMDWVQINQLIEMEQSRQNPVAQTIKLPLKLHENTATLLLGEPDFEDEGLYEDDVTESESSDDDDDQKDALMSDKRLSIDIDLSLTPWANAREYYGEKKLAAVKEKKTADSSEKALKSAEQKVLANLKKGLQKEADVLRPIRKQLWFEKFYYFIASEGYLVIGGRDNQQIDLLYRRYFQKGDVWVHADIKGAVPFIVKNRPGFVHQPIPPNALAQAGTLAVATSTAWDSKAVMAAWWVDADQVHKMDATGHYLDIGSFLITGEKNYLPPSQLLLGLGVMFRISPESKPRHYKHRIDLKGEPGTSEATVSVAENVVTESTPADNIGPEPLHEEIKPEDAEHDDASQGDEAASEASRSDVESDDEGDTKFQNPLQPRSDESQDPTKPMEDMSLSEDTASSADEEPLQADPDPTPHPDSPARTSTSTPSQPGKSPGKSKQQPQVRGKKGKLAKAKAKYAEQDDEERELAMRLLGSAPSQKPQKPTATPVSKEAEAAAQKERRRQQHFREETQNKAAEADRRKAIQAGTDLLQPEETAELKLVEDFVGTPLPGDEILDTLVVCGPWDALGPKLRWRVKMQPGTQKRGKALQEVLRNWNKSVEDREKKKLPPEGEPGREEEVLLRKEGELIRNIKDTETIGCIPVGKIRLVMAGGAGGKGGAGKSAGGGGGGGGKGGKGKGGGGGKGKGKKH